MNKERDRLRVDKKGELRDYEIMQPAEVPKPELNRAYQQDIIRDFKQLNEASDALLIAVQGTDEKCMKDVSKLAEKIAKCSKRLRQKLSQGGSVSKAEPISLNSVEGQTGQLHQLAESIDNLVEQVSTSKQESVTTVSLERMKQLEAIESHALSLRTLVKGKG